MPFAELAHGADAHRSMAMPPDIVLPGQFFTHTSPSPERRLMIAVLANAVETWEKSAGRCARCGRPPIDEVDAWFASDDVSWPFAFLSICHHLGFDPGYIRSGIAQLHRRAAERCECQRPWGDEPPVPHSPAEERVRDVRLRSAVANDRAVG